MTGEAPAEQVEYLSFEVIGGRPNRGHRVQRWAVAPQPNLQPHPFFLGDGEQVINNLEAWFRGEPVDASHVGEEIEGAIRVVAEQNTGLANDRPLDVDGHLVAVEFRSLHSRGVPGQ